MFTILAWKFEAHSSPLASAVGRRDGRRLWENEMDQVVIRTEILVFRFDCHASILSGRKVRKPKLFLTHHWGNTVECPIRNKGELNQESMILSWLNTVSDAFD